MINGSIIIIKKHFINSILLTMFTATYDSVPFLFVFLEKKVIFK